ncbi:hypothetical protein [Williamsia maris]|uniref:Uncharacterized protein n=1 Tax=Williamsia maris TaxID=72806 RepID=A0ABT1HBM7_9NOCA|nr:hypothetical protein [Williamsia maris]MCP2175663.1 hypothetical protein [Williamsia maris]
MSYPNHSSPAVPAGAFLDTVSGLIRDLYARAAADDNGHGARYETVADILVHSIPTHTSPHDLRDRPLGTVADQIALALFTAHRSLSPHTIEVNTLAAVRHTLTAAREDADRTARARSSRIGESVRSSHLSATSGRNPI